MWLCCYYYFFSNALSGTLYSLIFVLFFSIWIQKINSKQSNSTYKIVDEFSSTTIHDGLSTYVNFQNFNKSFKKEGLPINPGSSKAKYWLLYGICTDDTTTNVVSSLHYTKKQITNSFLHGETYKSKWTWTGSDWKLRKLLETHKTI